MKYSLDGRPLSLNVALLSPCSPRRSAGVHRAVFSAEGRQRPLRKRPRGTPRTSTSSSSTHGLEFRRSSAVLTISVITHDTRSTHPRVELGTDLVSGKCGLPTAVRPLRRSVWLTRSPSLPRRQPHEDAADNQVCASVRPPAAPRPPFAMSVHPRHAPHAQVSHGNVPLSLTLPFSPD